MISTKVKGSEDNEGKRERGSEGLKRGSEGKRDSEGK